MNFNISTFFVQLTVFQKRVCSKMLNRKIVEKFKESTLMTLDQSVARISIRGKEGGGRFFREKMPEIHDIMRTK